MPKQGVHPFGKRPLPKGRVEWAISETKSIFRVVMVQAPVNCGVINSNPKR